MQCGTFSFPRQVYLVYVWSRFALLLTSINSRRSVAHPFQYDGRLPGRDYNIPTCPYPVFPPGVRLPGSIHIISSQYLHLGKYRHFQVFLDNNITPAHSDEPYMQTFGKIVAARFHELLIEHASKMRLVKNPTYTYL